MFSRLDGEYYLERRHADVNCRHRGRRQLFQRMIVLVDWSERKAHLTGEPPCHRKYNPNER